MGREVVAIAVYDATVVSGDIVWLDAEGRQFRRGGRSAWKDKVARPAH